MRIKNIESIKTATQNLGMPKIDFAVLLVVCQADRRTVTRRRAMGSPYAKLGGPGTTNSSSEILSDLKGRKMLCVCFRKPVSTFAVSRGKNKKGQTSRNVFMTILVSDRSKRARSPISRIEIVTFSRESLTSHCLSTYKRPKLIPASNEKMTASTTT